MNILVTGASKGIGKEIANYLGKKNEIFAVARSEELLKKYKNYFVCDLSNQENLIKLGEYIRENKIDVIINNAGEYIYSKAENIKLEQLNHIMELNLKAPLYIISSAIPYMKLQKYGRIVNIGSISGVMGEANASLYSATKSGLIGATKALALELAEYNITVNTINPGGVDTDLGNSSIDDSEFSKSEIIDCIPQKRFVEPKEVASMVNYLISDDAKGVTGQSINLCAGLSVGY